MDKRPGYHSSRRQSRFRSHRPWRRKKPGSRFILFIWFAITFGTITLLVGGGLAALVRIITWVARPDIHRPSSPTWAIIIGLFLFMLFMGGLMIHRASRGIANPLSQIIDAAEAVRKGDLSTRIPENYRGMFSRLAGSFNQMVSELERNDKQRRNLTADIAHELRTPIHVIQGNLEGIIDGVYQPDGETINQLLDETHRLSRLVEDLHTLSLAEGGELPLSLETVHLTEIFEDVITSFSGQAGSAGIKLQADTPPTLTVSADPGRLVQVLSNLIVNALRHTPAEGTISLDAVPTEDGVRISIADTGEGIPPENLPFIFDRLWRGDRSRARKDHIGGYGLGLPIARQLIRAHGGELTVESEVGKGSIFTIDLPMG